MERSNDLEPVNGLVDNRRAAAMLGIPVSTFRVWATRAKTSETGITTHMPEPIATMHGNVYRASDIDAFAREVAKSSKQPAALAIKERRLGAYYTPDSASVAMAEWVLRGERDSLLEPSLGDGSFVRALDQVASKRGWRRPEVTACELDSQTAGAAIANGSVDADHLTVGDFLEFNPAQRFDAVIGNPPYVRLRALGSQTAKASAKKAARLSIGAELEESGSIWVPFTSKAANSLVRGGRLAFVLPLDFCYVRYARPLWAFLGRNFKSLSVLRFRERVFPGILQNVLILLADDFGGSTDRVMFGALQSVQDAKFDELSDLATREIPLSEIVGGRRPFQTALLSDATLGVIDTLAPESTRAADRAKFNIGYVSGDKDFFHPSPEVAKQFKLPKEHLFPTVADAKSLRAGGLLSSEIRSDQRLWLPDTELSPGELRYVREGESRGVDLRYKCRIRDPWYKVPGVRKPDLFLTTFSEKPRLIANDGGWFGSNSVLCGYLRPGQDAGEFVSSWYTPLTLLSIELEVHALGGGVLIAVPKEADSVVLPHAWRRSEEEVRELESYLRQGDLRAAYATGDRYIESKVGMDGVRALWEGIASLEAWRRSES